MKIVYVSDAIYPYNKGGKEKRLFELSTRIARMGNEVHIYTMHWWDGPENERVENGVHFHALSKLYPLYKGDKRSVKEGILFALACLKLFRVQFDVLDVDHMPFFPIFTSWLVCKLRGKRLYGTWHEALTLNDWVSYMGKGGYIAALVEHLSIKLPYKITAASAHTQQMLSSYHGRSKRVDLVASGIDAKTMQEVAPAQAECDVLYVGRLVKDKNVDKLVEAFALVAKKNPTARLVIVGHGIEKPAILQLIKKLRVTRRVTMLDPLPDARDVYAYMKRAKVFVLPSVREGFGIVVLEALACGTPVVTVDAPANAAKDLIAEHETGSVTELTPEALAEAIAYWLHESTSQHVAGDAHRHDWSTLASRQAGVYA